MRLNGLNWPLRLQRKLIPPRALRFEDLHVSDGFSEIYVWSSTASIVDGLYSMIQSTIAVGSSRWRKSRLVVVIRNMACAGHTHTLQSTAAGVLRGLSQSHERIAS